MVSSVSARVTVFLLTAVMVFVLAETWGVWGDQVTGQLPFPPLFFGCWRSLRSCARGVPSTREGKTRKIFGGNKRRRSAGEDFCGAQAPGGTTGARGAGTGTYNPKDSSQKTS